MADTKRDAPTPQIVLTSMMSIVDHTYEGELQPVGAIYNADARELENLEHHLRFAVHASGERAAAFQQAAKASESSGKPDKRSKS